LQFTAAFAIKFDQLKINGGGSYMNTNRIKDSDISIVVSVKVVNQAMCNLSHQNPTHPQRQRSQTAATARDFGDSFISGWQEGGEFLAVVSIKAKNRDEAQNIAAK
jgi:hypothetical protein